MLGACNWLSHEHEWFEHRIVDLGLLFINIPVLRYRTAFEDALVDGYLTHHEVSFILHQVVVVDLGHFIFDFHDQLDGLERLFHHLPSELDIVQD